MRQHTTPILLAGAEAVPLAPLSLGSGPDAVSEAALQQLIHDHPSCLPIAEIDPIFCGPVPICTELNTPAGPIDNFMVTPSGLPVLIECKLWRNPEGRREVVGQILDYAKELSRWSSSDLQREVSRRLGFEGNPLLEAVRSAGREVDEIDFNDALTLNLRRGRFLLLIVGDGIREGVEAITEYLQAHAGLHFTLGLVELPIYSTPEGQRLVVPRVLARTEKILRTVIEAPAGFEVSEDSFETGEDDSDEYAAFTPEERARKQEARQRRRDEREAFWREFLTGLALDDPEQQIPRPAKGGHIVFKFPAPGGSSWLTVYRSKNTSSVGIALSGNNNSPGQTAARMLEQDADALREELGPTATIEFGEEWPRISDTQELKDFSDPQQREAAFRWLRARTNDFVNALRPRIRAKLKDLGV